MTIAFTAPAPNCHVAKAPAQRPTPDRFAFWLKWIASAVQILGYTATSFGWTPWNLYLFIVGVFGWFAVGVLWNDRAIMLIHVVALGAMIAGLSRG